MKVAFDIDDTLWKIERWLDEEGNKRFRQVPDYDLIAVLRWFVKNGDDVFVWSAGGVGYAQNWVEKFGLDKLVKVIPKISMPKLRETPYQGMDIAFDDCETNNARVDVLVRREKDEEDVNS